MAISFPGGRRGITCHKTRPGTPPTEEAIPMSDTPSESPPPGPSPTGQPSSPPPPPTGYGQAPATAYQYGVQPGQGPVGKIRSTGVSILLMIVTLGIYGWFWYYSVHEEMKRHKGGDGLGGALAL